MIEIQKLESNLDEEKIVDLYINRKFGTPKIAKEFECSPHRIDRELKKLGIHKRTIQEAHKAMVERNGGHSHNYKGGRRISDGGYILIYAPGHPRATQCWKQYALEHIIIWEEANGKSLPKGYIIHHLNGIKTDNRPENLKAMKRGKHMTLAEPYKERIQQLEKEIKALKTRLGEAT